MSDELYKKARLKAAEMDTSVSAIVRKYLENLTAEESEFQRRKRLQQEILNSIREFSAADRLDRDVIHDRNALR